MYLPCFYLVHLWVRSTVGTIGFVPGLVSRFAIPVLLSSTLSLASSQSMHFTAISLRYITNY
jgi:hypothetical protein